MRNKNFVSLQTAAALLVFLVCSVTWGQINTSRLNLGNDPANPILDPYLLRHGWYAENSITSSANDATLPVGGTGTTSAEPMIVGTGNLGIGGTVTIGGADVCNATGFTEYRFQSASSNISGANTTNTLLFRGSGTSTNSTTSNPVYGTATTNDPTKKPGPRLPEFNASEYDRLNGIAITAPNASKGSWNGGSGTIGAGDPSKTIVYFVNDISLTGSVVINIKPGKTIVYVKNKISGTSSNNAIQLVDNSGNAISGVCGTNMNDYSVLFIVGGSGDIYNAAIELNFSATIRGTFIAPNSAIKIGTQTTRVNGQILTKDIRIDVGKYNGRDNSRFISFTPAVAKVQDMVVKEDRFWKGDNPPTYNTRNDGKSTFWKFDKNADWDTTATVTLSKAPGKSMCIPVKFFKGGTEITLSNSDLITTRVTGYSNSNGARIVCGPANSTGATPFIGNPGGGIPNGLYIQVGSAATSFSFGLNIKDDGIKQADEVITVSFPGTMYELSGNAWVASSAINPIPSFTITLKSDDPDISQMSANVNWTRSNFYEYSANNPNVSRDREVAKVSGATTTIATAGTASPGTLNYRLVSVTRGTASTSPNVTSLFTMASSTTGEIRTSSTFDADYDGTNDRTYRATVQCSSTVYGADSKGRTTVTVDMDLLPWNDNPFTLTNKTFSVTQGTPGTHNVFNTNDIDADQPTTINTKRLWGVSQDNRIINTSTGQALAWSLNLPSTSTLFSDIGKDRFVRKSSTTPLSVRLTGINDDVMNATVTVADDEKVTITLPTNQKLKSGDTYKFWYAALDSAANGYTTDTYTKGAEITVNVTESNMFPPRPQSITRTLDEGDPSVIFTLKTRRPDDGLSDDGDIKVLDDDWYDGNTNTTHYNAVIQSGATSKIFGVLTSSSSGIVYNLSSRPVTEEVFFDTITYTVKDDNGNGRSGSGEIFIIINPKNDNAPHLDNFTYPKDVVAYNPENISVAGAFKDLDRNVNSTNNGTNQNYMDQFRIDQSSWDIVKTGTTTSVKSQATVSFTDSVVTINFDKLSSLVNGDKLTFKYKVYDAPSYDNAGPAKISNVGEIYFNLQVVEDNVIFPANDTIVVYQKAEYIGIPGVADALYDGQHTVFWNDLVNPKYTGGNKAQPKNARVTQEPKHGKFEWIDATAGTFRYTHDGSNNFADTIKYSVWSAEEGGKWSNDVNPSLVGWIIVFVNQTVKDAPDLVNKPAEIKANARQKFVVIDSYDEANDNELALNSVKGLQCADPLADVSIVGDSTVSFKYKSEVDKKTSVVVTYWVDDAYKVTHKKYNGTSKELEDVDTTLSDGPFDQILTVTVLPNPKALEDITGISVGEEGESEINVGENDKFWKVEDKADSVSFEIISKPKNGQVFAGAGDKKGVISYRPNSGLTDYSDEFTYTIRYYVVDDDKDTIRYSDTVRVSFKIKPREPRPVEDGAYYEDTKGKGWIDRVTIPFDREVDNLLSTGFGIKFNLGGEQVKTLESTSRAYGKDAEGNENKKIVVLDLDYDKDMKDITSGVMTVDITHGTIKNDPITPKDSAAPAIKGEKAIYNLCVGGGNDTLKLLLTEDAYVGSSELPSIAYAGVPFKFVKKNGDVIDTISFIGANYKTNSAEKDTVVLIISAKSHGVISSEDIDSMFINWEAQAKMKDNLGNEQTKATNKRVKIEMVKTVQIRDDAATFFEVKPVKDGYVDLITLDVGMEVSQEIADGLMKTLKFPRGFVPTSAVVKNNVISFAGTESKAREVAATPAKKVFRKDGKDENKEYRPLTSLVETDVISLEEDKTFDGILTFKKGTIKIKDSIAPVVLYAIYAPAKSDKDSATLEVVFSEKVKVAAAVEPYKFKLRNDRVVAKPEYKIVTPLAPVSKAAWDDTWKYKVGKLEDIRYPLTGDSIWIWQKTVAVADSNGNIPEETVKALLEAGKYENRTNAYVVPNPLQLTKDGKGYKAKELDPKLLEYYGLGDKVGDPNYNIGTLIVVELSGPADVKKQSGALKVLDQTGNLVVEKPMLPVVTKSGAVALVAVWNGKNHVGRTVGPSTYLAFTPVVVQFDDEKDAKPFTPKPNIIAVTIGGEVLK